MTKNVKDVTIYPVYKIKLIRAQTTVEIKLAKRFWYVRLMGAVLPNLSLLPSIKKGCR